LNYLRDILYQSGVLEVIGSADVEISSLHFDSRLSVTGSLFFAIRGTGTDGHLFIDKAIEKGAIAIVSETLPETVSSDVTYVIVKNSSEAMGQVASNFYGHPSSRLELVGVTGTNGKTTTVTLLYQLFMRMGHKTGLISTISNKVNEKVFPSTHTTPDPIRLNELLSCMVAEGCTHCFMEVSSHAIDQKRIAGLTFKGGIFTNLTHDHLDYHKTFAAYLKAKKTFFDHLPSGTFALVNKDDKNGSIMVQNTKAKTYNYSLQSPADFRCRIVENQFHGLELNIQGQECWFRLIGVFNAYNLLVVYSAGILLGLDSQAILTVLSAIEPVEGRFNYLTSKTGVTAIVDYAHTPDAIQNVLETINSIRTFNEQLIMVVGAGGNRDKTKRPIMAKIACQWSDKVILTSDNPRFEEPEQIIEEMKKGVDIESSKKMMVVVNRREAIMVASRLSRPGDILLVAGKGHETYQEIRGVKYPFDDKEVLKEALEIES
jgi:UDP-N-acetylmuramoyl-L-alanyl-D-glutamate--2,6-diaminopimelate ligase